MLHAYPCKFTEENGLACVSFRDIPEALSQTDLLRWVDEIAAAQMVLRDALNEYMRLGRAIPLESRPLKDEVVVPVDEIFLGRLIRYEEEHGRQFIIK